MAREWTLQETSALVEEHILLKQHEKVPKGSEVRVASEHWNKIAKKLRERGFNRSHKSCNKRWYRLEQYEVQIFSFNIEEGKHRNYWDLTRAERLEHRLKWPQLPLGDGIDKEIFNSLKRFSLQCCERIETPDVRPSVEKKEVGGAEKDVGIGNRFETSILAPAPIPLPVPIPVANHVSVPVAEVMTQPRTPEVQEPEKEIKTSWPRASDQTLSSQDALDGFKLQARELRRRRAAELRRNHRTVPYNTTHTTFVKNQAPQGDRNSPPAITQPPPEVKEFKGVSSPEYANKNLQPDGSSKVLKENSSVEQIQIQKTHDSFNSGPILYKVDTNPSSQPQLPIGSHLTSVLQPSENPRSHPSSSQHPDSSFTKHHDQTAHQTQHSHVMQPTSSSGHLPLLQSINSHLPLLQPKDSHINQHKPAQENHHSPLDSDSLPTELLQLSSLEEQLQVILGVHPGPLKAQNSDQHVHMSHNMDGHQGHNQNHQGNQFRRQAPERHCQENMGPNAGLLGAAIGGLEVQLGAIVKLLQVKHAAEQQFREKLLLFVECMVVSLHTMAQANARTGG